MHENLHLSCNHPNSPLYQRISSWKTVVIAMRIFKIYTFYCMCFLFCEFIEAICSAIAIAKTYAILAHLTSFADGYLVHHIWSRFEWNSSGNSWPWKKEFRIILLAVSFLLCSTSFPVASYFSRCFSCLLH